jgi:hypothetical protein
MEVIQEGNTSGSLQLGINHKSSSSIQMEIKSPMSNFFEGEKDGEAGDLTRNNSSGKVVLKLKHASSLADVSGAGKNYSLG